MAAEALHVELLHRCPLRCLPCDHRLLGVAELSPALLRAALKEPELRALRLVSFSGGEPLLHPGLAAMLRATGRALPAARLVLLSGLWDAKALGALLRSLPAPLLRRLHIGSSLDGTPAVHDRMRGIPGAFARLERSLALLAAEFPQVSAGLTFTACSVNARHFHGAWLAARRLGVPLGLQFLVPNANTAGLQLDARAAKLLAAGIKAALGDAAGGVLPDAETANLRAALAHLEGKAAAAACGAGSAFFMLSPEGLFYLCPFHKELTARPGEQAGLAARLTGPARKACAGCFLRCAMI